MDTSDEGLTDSMIIILIDKVDRDDSKKDLKTRENNGV